MPRNRKRYTSAPVWEKVRAVSRDMRRNPTSSEDRLWQALRDRRLDGLKFRRQHSIGSFVVDFYCFEARLAVEVDGPIHRLSAEADTGREEILRARGVRMIRFTNAQVAGDLDGVLAALAAAVHAG